MNKIIPTLEGDRSTIVGRLALVVTFAALIGIGSIVQADVIEDQWKGMDRTEYTGEDIYCDPMSFYNNSIYEIGDVYNLGLVFETPHVHPTLGSTHIFIFSDAMNPDDASKFMELHYVAEYDMICLVREGSRST